MGPLPRSLEGSCLFIYTSRMLIFQNIAYCLGALTLIELETRDNRKFVYHFRLASGSLSSKRVSIIAISLTAVEYKGVVVQQKSIGLKQCLISLGFENKNLPS